MKFSNFIGIISVILLCLMMPNVQPEGRTFAQGDLGTFTVTFTDDLGNPVPYAAITVTDFLGLTTDYCTDLNGEIASSSVALGLYTVDLDAVNSAACAPSAAEANVYVSTLSSSTSFTLSIDQLNVSLTVVLATNVALNGTDILAPVNNEKINSQTYDITWDAVGGASAYRVVVREQSNYTYLYDNIVSAYDSCSGLTCSITGFDTPSDIGGYSVFVQSRDASQGYSWAEPIYFTKGNPSPAPDSPIFITPTSDAIIQSGMANITFDDINKATRYAIYVYSYASAQWIVAENNLNQGSLSACNPVCYYPDANYADGTYIAYLRAANHSGWGDWSSGVIFTISPDGDVGTNTTETGTPIPVTISNPTGIISNNEPVVMWNDVGSANNYRILVQDVNGTVYDETFGTNAVCDDGVCVLQLPTLADGDYQVNVLGQNNHGTSEWSDPALFTIQS